MFDVLEVNNPLGFVALALAGTRSGSVVQGAIEPEETTYGGPYCPVYSLIPAKNIILGLVCVRGTTRKNIVQDFVKKMAG